MFACRQPLFVVRIGKIANEWSLRAPRDGTHFPTNKSTNIASNKETNIASNKPTFFNNVFEGVVRTREDVAGQRDARRRRPRSEGRMLKNVGFLTLLTAGRALDDGRSVHDQRSVRERLPDAQGRRASLRAAAGRRGRWRPCRDTRTNINGKMGENSLSYGERLKQPETLIDLERVAMPGRPIRTFTVLPHLPDKLRQLRELSYNLWWSWNPDAVNLFRRIDPDLYEAVENSPIKLMSSTPQSRFETRRSMED